MVYLILFDIVFVFLAVALFKKNKAYMALSILFIVGFSIYSGVGIALYGTGGSKVAYAMNFGAFSMLFLLVGILTKDRQSGALKKVGIMFESHKYVLLFMTGLYFLTFIYPLILGGITLREFFNLSAIFEGYSATPFSIRLERRSNALYMIMINQVRTICRPFFYMMLYTLRKKPVEFLTMYILPTYCSTIADGYISRNNLAVFGAFIIVYLIAEGIVSKKIMIPAIVIGIPVVMAVFNGMAGIRHGKEFTLSMETLWNDAKALIDSECSYTRFYEYCNEMTSLPRTLSFLVYILVAFVPSQLYRLVGFTAPNLAYEFTEFLIGLTYGEGNYFILLPSVLGEAIILFGKNFAWIYGAYYGLFAFWFVRLLSGHESLKYLKYAFLLDFFRQFRGGSQFVLTSWITTLIPFIVIISILSRVRFSAGGQSVEMSKEVRT